MIGFENRVLRSERLTYRLLDIADKAPLHKILSDNSVAEAAGFLAPDTDEKFNRFFTVLTKDHTGLAILNGETLIGYIHVFAYQSDLPEHQDKKGVSLGFAVGKKYQNQGYGTEALNAMTAYLKQRFDYCIADHFVGNAPSQRVIEKCGYRYFEEYTMLFEELGKEMTCLSYIC